MTTDPTGPKGPFIAIDEGKQGGDQSAAVLYWFGPEGRIYVLDAGPHLIEWSIAHDPTSWEPGETGSFVAAVVNSAGPWELTPGTELIPETPAKPAGDPNG